MVSAGLQMLGIALAVVGWIGVIVVCVLPMWLVTAFIGQNIVTAQITWEGIWMSCVVQSTGQMQCKVYDSMLALSSDLQAARALTIISILVGVVGILLATAGGKCTNCIEDERAKARVGIVSGAIFIVAGVLCLIPICWTANMIIRDFYNPMTVSAQKKDDLKMVSQGLQIMGISTAMLGWLGVIVVCALPQWKVSAFIGANIVTAQIIWEGMWMNCVVQSTGQMQCKVYDSMLALSSDLQAGRAMIIISILTGLFGIVISLAGGKCTNCIEDQGSKSKACIVAGILLIISGLLCMIPVSWAAHTTIRDFYNPMMVEAQRRELGAALYVGWGSAGLLLLGGGILCWNCPPKQERIYNPKFSAVRSNSGPREFV
ncbi:claudin-4-like [Labeo rohita]|nr:claudin-4-like [Labeo rohita]